MVHFSSLIPYLITALGLGAFLGWAFQSWRTHKRIRKLEETWGARWQHRENELELTNAKLGSLLNALQTSHNASQATIRVHEASLAECQSKRGELENRLAAQGAEFDRTWEALSREIRDWENRHDAVVRDKEAEISRLLSRVRELEPLTVRVQAEEAEFLRITRDKDAQINQLQLQVRELERVRSQRKHWKFSVLLQERESAPAKLTPLPFRP